MIKSCKEEFDRLMETSPIIPDKIINKFTKTFKKNDNYLLIKKPEICDELISTEQSRNPWSTDESITKKAKLMKNIASQNHKDIMQFKKRFYNLNNREAFDSEVIDNLKEDIDINTINNILNDLKGNELTNYNKNNDTKV